MNFNLKDSVGFWSGRLGRFALDTSIMGLAYWGAYLLRFEFHGPPNWGWAQVATSFVTVWVVQHLMLEIFGCNRLLWRYVSVADIPRFIGALGSATFLLLLARIFMASISYAGIRPPYSIILLNSFLATGGLLGARLLWRLVREAGGSLSPADVSVRRARRVLLVGAGAAGNLVARELRQQGGKRQQVVGFVDDDPAKARTRIQGYKVLGTIAALPRLVRLHAVDEVIISMSRVSREVVRRVLRLCKESQVVARIVPGYYELIEGSVSASAIRDIDVADLLGRVERETDQEAVVELINDKRVMITGAGGSIGSELVRQILRAGPELIVLVERSENALYEIEREIRALGPSVAVRSVLMDIGQRAEMRQVFEEYRPNIVMHAAAYKHVPLMEHNALQAIKNNVLATRTLGELSLEYGVLRFVFISTDKAVNPVSVMGQSKRLAEVVLQELNQRGSTRFAAVRFGNVLGSSGSVVPLFREQIRKGEAVTVTHPEMQRYFMTITEAVSLVLQATTLAQGGEIFVLDMGEPVKILELAHEMITLSGLRPYEDVPIVFSGIRPGEKLREELDVSEKSAYKTGHARIYVCKLSEVRSAEVAALLDLCRQVVGGHTPPTLTHALARRLEAEGVALTTPRELLKALVREIT